MAATTRPFDVVIFGATGFTGQLAAAHLARRLKSENLSAANFALAGRSEEKLLKVRQKLETIEPKAKDLAILVGDCSDEDFLAKMLQSTRVVMTYVGPFIKYGLPLARACVKYGTDYCDITGEAPYQRKIIDELHEKAKSKGVTLLTGCGYDSVPFDVGTYGLIKHLKSKEEDHFFSKGKDGTTISVQALTGAGKGGFSGGTIASVGGSVDNMKDMPSHVLDPSFDESKLVDPLYANGAFHEPSQKWLLTSFMEPVNIKVLYRTRMLLEDMYGEAFVWQQFIALPSRFARVVAGAVLGIFVSVLTSSTARGLLLRLGVLPKPGEGPSEDIITNGYFNEYIFGKISKGTQSCEAAVHVKGVKGDPGYGLTSAMSLHTAMCLSRKEELKDRIHMLGGVLTPASCMGDVLWETLPEVNVSFELYEDVSKLKVK